MAIQDRFEKFYTDPNDPANYAYQITPDSSNDVSFYSRAVYVGSGGDLVVSMVTDTSNTFVTFSSVPAGTILPIRIKRLSEASTANNIIGLY